METLDGKRLEREIKKVMDAPVSMHLSVRRFPGFWVTQPMPPEINTPEDALEYARRLAVRDKLKVGLTAGDRGTIWFDETGRVVSRTFGDE